MSSSPVSSAVSAPPGRRRLRAPSRDRIREAIGHPAFRSGAASLLLGLALAAVAFGAEGGNELGGTTTVTILLILAGGVAAAAAVAFAPLGRAWGAGTLALFAFLALITGLSVVWSVAPEQSWFHANKTLGYLFVFAGALGAVRLAPQGWPVVLKGILIGAAIVTAYALASRVFPGALAENELYARIGAPFQYWNAVGTTAALAVVPALWLGARRSGHTPLNALAFPLLGMLIVALFLSYSRGALAAAVIGAALWLVFVPLRLRSLGVLLVSALGATPVILWALSKAAFTADGVPLAVRESVAGEFGLFLLAMLAVLLAAGLGAGFLAGRRAPSRTMRRRVGIAAVGAGAGLALLAFGSVAFSDRGIGGTISDLTNEEAAVTGGPERLTTASSSRARYWSEAFDVFEHNTLLGAGGDSFRTARLPYRDDVLVSSHAHGYVAQTASDLGLLGLAITLALAGAFLAAAARTLGVGRGMRGLPFDSERAGLAALALAALVFGLHSAIDWTWFVPGPAVMALIAGAWVAGRGPLPSVRREDAPTGELPAGAAAAPAAAGGGPRARFAAVPRERMLAAGLVLLTAVLCAWTAWQPARSNAASNHALALLADGELAEAAREADNAYDINPLSPKPLFVKAQVLSRAGNEEAAESTLEQAVVEHPARPDVWLRLADFQLDQLDRPHAAIDTLRGALYLDPRSRQAQTTFFRARTRLREQEAARAVGS